MKRATPSHKPQAGILGLAALSDQEQASIRKHLSNGHGLNLVVALSGGKDSTAMALRLAELGVPFKLLYTPTGAELPEVRAHIERIVQETGAELIDLGVPSLAELIEEQRCLPNFRMRWCTRMIKIEPVQQWWVVRDWKPGKGSKLIKISCYRLS